MSFVLLLKRPGPPDPEQGIGAFAIDACRLPGVPVERKPGRSWYTSTGNETVREQREPIRYDTWKRPGKKTGYGEGWNRPDEDREGHPGGRWPPNVLVLDGHLAEKLDCITRTSGYSQGALRNHEQTSYRGSWQACSTVTGYGDSGPVSRFFPRLTHMEDVRAWVRTLLTPPSITS